MVSAPRSSEQITLHRGWREAAKQRDLDTDLPVFMNRAKSYRYLPVHCPAFETNWDLCEWLYFHLFHFGAPRWSAFSIWTSTFSFMERLFTTHQKTPDGREAVTSLGPLLSCDRFSKKSVSCRPESRYQAGSLFSTMLEPVHQRWEGLYPVI